MDMIKFLVVGVLGLSTLSAQAKTTMDDFIGQWSEPRDPGQVIEFVKPNVYRVLLLNEISAQLKFKINNDGYAIIGNSSVACIKDSALYTYDGKISKKFIKQLKRNGCGADVDYFDMFDIQTYQLERL